MASWWQQGWGSAAWWRPGQRWEETWAAAGQEGAWWRSGPQNPPLATVAAGQEGAVAAGQEGAVAAGQEGAAAAGQEGAAAAEVGPVATVAAGQGAWANFMRGQARVPQPSQPSLPGEGSKRTRRLYKRQQKYLIWAHNALIKAQKEWVAETSRNKIFDVHHWAEDVLSFAAYERVHQEFGWGLVWLLAFCVMCPLGTFQGFLELWFLLQKLWHGSNTI